MAALPVHAVDQLHALVAVLHAFSFRNGSPHRIIPSLLLVRQTVNDRTLNRTAAAAVAEMVQLDYVNDARYAEARAHSLLAARKSRRAAAQNLRQKGLAPAEVAGALEAVYAPEDGDDPELEAAAALVDSRYRKKLAIGRRDLVVAALQRRGFAYPVIKEAIRRVEEE